MNTQPEAFVPVKRKVLESLLGTLGAVQGAYMHDKETPPDYLNESIRDVSAALEQPGVEPVGYLAFRDGKPAWDEDCVCEDAIYPVDSDDGRVSVAIYTAPQPAQQPVAAVSADEVENGIEKLRAEIDILKKNGFAPQPAQQAVHQPAQELETVRVFGVRPNGEVVDTGINTPLPPRMKARELVREMFGPFEDDDASDADLCFAVCEQLIEWLVAQGWSRTAPQPAPQPDARATAIQACIDRLEQGGKPAEAGILRHHFAKDLGGA